MAPGHRRQQGLLSGQRRAGSAGEQPEPLVEISCDALGGELSATRRGKLDGQRDAIEPAARLDDGRQLNDVETQVRPGAAGPIENSVTAS
jgi:hypothetical protein